MRDLVSRHIKYLDRKRRDIDILRKDYERNRDGWRTYYIADYSELYSYLHFEEDFSSRADRYSTVQDRDIARIELRLSLSYLFRNPSKSVHLTEPHARELWNHFVRIAVDPARVRFLADRARAKLESLAPEGRETLRLLVGGEDVSDTARNLLSDEIVTSFAEILAALDEALLAEESFVTASEQLESIRKNVVLSLQPICLREGVDYSEVRQTPKEDLRRVFNYLGPRYSTSPYAKYRDAEAILMLRGLNAQLRPKGARALLVTRDIHIQDAIEELAGELWFGWPDAVELMRRPQFLVLELLAASTDEKRALQWMADVDQTVSNLRELADPAVPRQPTDPRRLFERARSDWWRHFNVRLAEVSRSMPWMAEAVDRHTGLRSAEARSTRRTQDQLWNLLHVVQMDENRERLHERAQSAWASFMGEGMLALFLKVFSETDAADVRDLVCEVYHTDDPKIVLRTTSPGTISSLQFRSPYYRDAFESLMVQTGSKRRRRRRDPKRGITEVMARILSRGDNENSQAESLLFIGLIFATLGRWREADQCARYALQTSLPLNRDEAYYVRAVSERMISLMSPNEAVASLSRGFSYIQRARAERADELADRRGENPRYLKELAIILMLYHDGFRTGQYVGSPRVVPAADVGLSKTSLPMALGAIEEALQVVESDVRLRAELLNGAAYCAALPAIGAFEEAHRWLAELKALVQEWKRSGLLADVEGPAYEFTRWFVAASESKHEDDDTRFQEAVAAIEEMLTRRQLSETERAFFSDSCKRLAQAT